MTEKTIEIKITTYSKETPELRAEFKRLGLHEFDSLDFQYKNMPDRIYHIELDHVFSNQYNTVEGYRVFEKCTCVYYNGNKKIKGHGYYISDGIEKIRDYQKDLTVCHYCGTQYYKSDVAWCEKRRANEYLEPKNYHLLKLTNIHDKYAPIDIPIPEDILTDIKTKQTQATKIRLEKKIQYAFTDLAKRKIALEKEEIFLRRLIPEYYPDIDNVIYYNHTDTFCIGWRKSLTDEEKKHLNEVTKNWPYTITLK